MDAIVSVTDDWGIGRNGNLLVRNREDMRRFVRLTMGGTVLMGHSTFLSFPGGPLKGRRNVVLSRNPNLVIPGAEVFNEIAQALEATSGDEKVWLIGGESLYRQLLPHCSHVYVTRNHVVVPADAWFPNLDRDQAWVAGEPEGSGTTTAGVSFDFVTYARAGERG
jgi:dihydrofolate reductase